MKKVNRAKKVKKVDLGAIFDAHVRHEFVDHDVAATMKTMVAEPYVHNVPTLIGGDGHAGVVDFYTHHFVGKMPADTRIERISRSHTWSRPSKFPKAYFASSTDPSAL